MKINSKIIIILGCVWIVIGLPGFLIYGGLLPDIFIMLGGILWIIIGVFRNKGYFNKNYYMAVFSVIALWGLMLLYIFLFKTNEYLSDTDMFYIFAGLFMLLVISFGRYYIRGHKEFDL